MKSTREKFTKEERRAYFWIKKKLNEGENIDVLFNRIGMFSNRSKKKTMSLKNIDSKEYDRRRKFLSTCYDLIEEGFFWKF